jgi:hypothetical protein
MLLNLTFRRVAGHGGAVRRVRQLAGSFANRKAQSLCQGVQSGREAQSSAGGRLDKRSPIFLNPILFVVQQSEASPGIVLSPGVKGSSKGYTLPPRPKAIPLDKLIAEITASFGTVEEEREAQLR